MTYDYDWCGHVAEDADGRPCGAPIERWSREWKHRKYELDADHKAVPQAPVGPLEEGLHLRADRYATAIAASVAADERIAALTELLRQHEYYRSQAESALGAVQEDPQFGTVWAPTGPEPEDADALLCLITGNVYYRRRGVGMLDGWRRAEATPQTATIYEWPISDAGPFIAWRDSYGFDQVLREAQRRDVEFDQLHRKLYSQDGYRADGSPWGRPNLAEAIDRILLAKMQRTYEANEKAQRATQMLAQLRRSIEHLAPDDTQQWLATQDGDDEVREVDVIDLDKVRALLDRKDCGGEVL
jgi:hypothetical protein